MAAVPPRSDTLVAIESLFGALGRFCAYVLDRWHEKRREVHVCVFVVCSCVRRSWVGRRCRVVGLWCLWVGLWVPARPVEVCSQLPPAPVHIIPPFTLYRRPYTRHTKGHAVHIIPPALHQTYKGTRPNTPSRTHPSAIVVIAYISRAAGAPR